MSHPISLHIGIGIGSRASDAIMGCATLRAEIMVIVRKAVCDKSTLIR